MPGGRPDDPPPYSPGPTVPTAPYQAAPPSMTSPPMAAVIHNNAPLRTIPVTVIQQMGPKPTTITCKSCNFQIVTRVESRPTMRTHLFALLLLVIGCWPCVCVPYCVDSCNNADHYCPNCNSFVGTYVN